MSTGDFVFGVPLYDFFGNIKMQSISEKGVYTTDYIKKDSISMFIGACDRAGEEIYENDFVLDSNNDIWFVKFDLESLSYVLENCHEESKLTSWKANEFLKIL